MSLAGSRRVPEAPCSPAANRAQGQRPWNTCVRVLREPNRRRWWPAGTQTAISTIVRSLLERWLDRVTRSEQLAIVGIASLDPTSPPALALRDVAQHAESMQPRFFQMVAAHDLHLHSRVWFALGRWFHGLRPRPTDRAFQQLVAELHTGVGLVEHIRKRAHRLELFGLVRWSDDWLGARRALIARLAAQLAWFVEGAGTSDADAS